MKKKGKEAKRAVSRQLFHRAIAVTFYRTRVILRPQVVCHRYGHTWFREVVRAFCSTNTVPLMYTRFYGTWPITRNVKQRGIAAFARKKGKKWQKQISFFEER